LALALLVITIIAYERHGIRRPSRLSIVFGQFILKVGISHLDSTQPIHASELNVALVAAELEMLSTILLAVMRE